MVADQRLLAEFDAVYFLMWDGWKTELQSNRWHYISRCARHAPSVLVQPDLQLPSAMPRVEIEERIPNCRILHIKSSSNEQSFLEDVFVQMGQTASDMRAHGITRPLLWLFNPHLVGLYAMMPARGRLLHATENYFHFTTVPEYFINRLRTAIQLSDLVIAVSDGVASSIRRESPAAAVNVVSNGCDFAHYSSYRPDTALREAGTSFSRIAVYAGNINDRLDFQLAVRCARECRDTLFAFYGPVKLSNPVNRESWEELLAAPNARHFGPVGPAALPGIYGAADVGIIPYQHEKVLVENGFPLKALEMGATGLPVVSTLMRPLTGLARAVKVAESGDQFLAELKSTSRSSLPQDQRAELLSVAEENDYERKFREVCGLASNKAAGNAQLSTRIDGFLQMQEQMHEWSKLSWTAWQLRAGHTVEMARLATLDLRLRLQAFLHPLYVRLPAPIKRWLRQRRAGSTARDQ